MHRIMNSSGEMEGLPEIWRQQAEGLSRSGLWMTGRKPVEDGGRRKNGGMDMRMHVGNEDGVGMVICAGNGMKIDMEAVKAVVKEAGKLFRDREAAGHTRTKGVADYVTEVDFAVQRFICGKLQELYPEVQFMGEEKSNEEIDRAGLVWVLDPVDGTTNLIHDYRNSAVSLAFMDNQRIVMGIVYNPYADEMFWAAEGKGCYRNGRRVRVSGAVEMGESLISIGTSPYYKELAEENFPVFQTVFMDCQDIRRTGSAALDLANVACGRIEGYFERGLKLWDFAAGMLLVREAGGLVLDYRGADAGTGNVSDIVAGNGRIPRILVEEYLGRA